MSGRAVLRPAPHEPSPSLARFEALISEAEAIGADLELDCIPDALGSLERVRSRLNLRAFSAAQPSDRLLGITEASSMLGMAKDTLYRKAKSYPFMVQQGRSLRFSKAGIEKYIRSRQGRG
jgi:predicted DNA-binding transcriptional regulator AlpA